MSSAGPGGLSCYTSTFTNTDTNADTNADTNDMIMTRKVTAHLFHSVNGVVESPNLWQFDAFGSEEGELMGASIGPVTDLVLGRKLWQEWSDYWPNTESDEEYAGWINPIRKHVVTGTLSGDLGWNSTAIDGDPVA